MLVRTAGEDYGMWTKVGQEGQKQDGGGLESRVGTPRRRPAVEGEESGELRLPSFGLVLNLSTGMTISVKFRKQKKKSEAEISASSIKKKIGSFVLN